MKIVYDLDLAPSAERDEVESNYTVSRLVNIGLFMLLKMIFC